MPEPTRAEPKPGPTPTECRAGHGPGHALRVHLTEESAAQCDAGRVGWWGCSLARPGCTWDGHFMHVSSAEAAACDLERGVFRSVVE